MSEPTAKQPWSERYGIHHLALIPDGNRRWARERALPIEAGHDRGMLDALPALAAELFADGLHTLTLFCFSTENWGRAAGEVDHLMGIFAQLVDGALPRIAARDRARVCHLGRSDRLPERVRQPLTRLVERSAPHDAHVLNLALDYGGPDELQRAAERLVAAARTGAQPAELRIADFLDTSGQPHPQPDLLLRTAGEQRMSGFLPLQSAYTELFFVDQPFPELTLERVRAIADAFSARTRHFGR
jgi:undecaprenyl diphosphate synthase